MLGITYGTDPVQDVIAGLLLVTTIYGVRSARQAKANGNKLDDVHSLVNQQLTDSVERRDVAEARTKQLEDEAKEP
jgi:hypothetical protein